MANASKVLSQLESILQSMSEDIVGLIMEPIQGAGGNRVALPSFFRGLSELCHKYGIYLAFDEVQTGLGPTGKMWAIDHFDLPHRPIAVASGKKWGNGLLYMADTLEDIGILDSTWGGNTADMVRVCREVEIVQREGLIERAATNGTLLSDGLKKLVAKYGFADNVRGMGLYQGFSLDTDERKGKLIRAARENHSLLLLGAGNRSIRTRPNLSVTSEEIELFLKLLDLALADVA
jgi:L-lysine 6-transaminase